MSCLPYELCKYLLCLTINFYAYSKWYLKWSTSLQIWSGQLSYLNPLKTFLIQNGKSMAYGLRVNKIYLLLGYLTAFVVFGESEFTEIFFQLFQNIQHIYIACCKSVDIKRMTFEKRAWKIFVLWIKYIFIIRLHTFLFISKSTYIHLH